MTTGTFLENSIRDADTSTVVLSLITSFICVLCIAIIVDIWKHRKMPSGPRTWPILGNLPNIYIRGHLETFREYRLKFGELYRLKLGFWHAIVISNKDLLKEISASGCIDDRPLFFTNRCIGGTKMGIVFAKLSKRLIFQRKVALNALKSFTGFKNQTFEEILEEQAQNLSQELLDRDGHPYCPKESVFFTSGKIVFHTVYGKSCDPKEDSDLKYLIENIQDFKNFTKVGNIWDVMPYLFFLAPHKFWKFIRILGKMRDFGVKKIKEHQKSYDNSNIRDVMDSLIKASKQYTKEEKMAIGISSAQILMSVFDFIGAGFDTVASTISWGILYLADNFTVQEKCHQEINRVLLNQGSKLSTRSQLPYVEATVLETIRMAACVPMGIPRATSSVLKIRNYEIPPNTVVILDIIGMSYDEKVWENPYKFQPERFLNSDGAINQQMVEKLVSFGIGKRRCLGEAMAKQEIFFLFTHLLQKFYFIHPGKPLSLEGEYAFVREPRAFEIIIKIK